MQRGTQHRHQGSGDVETWSQCTSNMHSNEHLMLNADRRKSAVGRSWIQREPSGSHLIALSCCKLHSNRAWARSPHTKVTSGSGQHRALQQCKLRRHGLPAKEPETDACLCAPTAENLPQQSSLVQDATRKIWPATMIFSESSDTRGTNEYAATAPAAWT